MIDLPLRLKRLRFNQRVRDMLQETHLFTQQLIMPMFINAGLTGRQAIQSMPGQYQLSLNDLSEEIQEITALKIPAVLLFGIPSHKDIHGSASLDKNGIIQQAIQTIRTINKDLIIISDVCLCEYTSHGHCGVLAGETIDNDKTLEVLAAQAISYAEAGTNWVAPSAMTDGMVKAIRQALDKAGYIDTAVLSYAVKYASSLYGPFREAALGAPQFGNRLSYQMNPANASEALREARLDVMEGADMLMVKPAMHYLDIIYRVKQEYPEIPLAAYQISGEYAMLQQAITAKIVTKEQAITESIIAIKRAGADLIISYFAKDLARLLS